MNMKDLRDIGIALVLSAVVCLVLFGCDGSGGVGGQGIVFKSITVADGGTFTVTLDVDDGGTSLIGENPSREPSPQPEPSATTKPSVPVTPPLK